MSGEEDKPAAEPACGTQIRRDTDPLDGGSFRCCGNGDWIGLRDKAKASGTSEEFVEALEIFDVERVINVGAQIQRKFFFRKLQLAGGFATDSWQMLQAESE